MVIDSCPIKYQNCEKKRVNTVKNYKIEKKVRENIEVSVFLFIEDIIFKSNSTN